MKRKRLLITLAAILLFTLFAVWFADSEKRLHTASNVWRDVIQQGRGNSIMFGSSTIRKFDADRLLECGNWENRGIGTAGIPNIQNYLRLPLKRWSPKWILVYGGDNDVARDRLNAEQTIALHDELNTELLERFQQATLLLLEIKPSPKRQQHHESYREINAHLASFAEEAPRALYVSSQWEEIVSSGQQVFQDDGVHLNEAGNKIMAQSINKLCKNQ